MRENILNSVMKSEVEKGVDIYRDTYVRYLGYANEVGEAFRSLVTVGWVRLSYCLASAYVLADALDKGNRAKKKCWPDEAVRKKRVLHNQADTLIWQGLASVIIPGFTINRICYLSLVGLTKLQPKLPANARKWTTTCIGLASIPFIIKPIDTSVDYMMHHYGRRWLHLEVD